MNYRYVLVISVCLSASPAAAQTLLESSNFDNPIFATTFVEDGDHFWFSAVNFVEGGELWRSDGSPAGTIVAGEATPGNEVELPFETIALEGKAFFLLDTDQDVGLWMTDGSPAGLLQLSEHAVPANADKNPAFNGLAHVNGIAVAFADSSLIAINPSNGDTTHLYRTHGLGFVKGQTFVYAFASNPTTFADELLRTDGTALGTTVLANITFTNDDQIGIIDDKLVFVADDFSGTGEELFVSDGTVGGSGFLPELLAGDDDIACFDMQPGTGVLYFGFRSASLINCKPYMTDGTALGTVPVVDTTGFQIYGMSEASEFVYYWESAVNLWRTDGTSAGTIKLATLDGTSTPVVAFEGAAWFAGFEGAGYNLWRSDGTPGGTQRFFTDPAGTLDPLSLTVIGDRLYFSAFNSYYIESVETGVETLIPNTPFELNVYPNPTPNDVTLVVRDLAADPTKEVVVTVYDVLGRTVYSNTYDRTSRTQSILLPLQQASSGIYFARVSVGNQASVIKLVRQ